MVELHGKGLQATGLPHLFAMPYNVNMHKLYNGALFWQALPVVTPVEIHQFAISPLLNTKNFKLLM